MKTQTPAPRPADRVTDNTAWFHERYVLFTSRLDAFQPSAEARRTLVVPTKPQPTLP